MTVEPDIFLEKEIASIRIDGDDGASITSVISRTSPEFPDPVKTGLPLIIRFVTLLSDRTPSQEIMILSMLIPWLPVLINEMFSIFL